MKYFYYNFIAIEESITCNFTTTDLQTAKKK